MIIKFIVIVHVFVAKINNFLEYLQMELGNVINVLNQAKTPTLSIMDLGKQLLENAREGQKNKVHDLMCRGAPFTTDWVCIDENEFIFHENEMKT